jgi:low affinity Fe/Cu permease
MRDLVAGIIGIAMVFVFMGIILWWVKAWPLIVICIAVAVMLIYDFLQNLRLRENGNGG